MQDIIQIPIHQQNGPYDITNQVKEAVSRSGIKNGMVSVYIPGDTAAIMILFYLIDPLLARFWIRSK